VQQLKAMSQTRLEWQEAAEPKLLSATDALVRPIAVAVCDADVSYLRGQLPPRDPFCFGHEFVAEVVSLGEDVTGCAIGDRVVVAFLIACGTCRRCRQGYPAACTTVPPKSAYGFGIFGDWGGAASDLVRVPYASTMMVKLPGDVSPIDAASAGDNLSDGFRCVEEGLQEEPGAPVLIVAGGGRGRSIGLYAAALARALGSEKVDYMDTDRGRLSIAEALGANPVEVATAPDRHGSYWITADTGLHPSGRWLSTALKSTAPYGRCTSCGIYHQPAALPLGTMYRQGVRLVIGWPNVQTLMPRVLDLLGRANVPLQSIHTVVPWSEAVDALQDPPDKLVFVRDEILARASARV
jgi:threonine dehydrogenase-like Zn-dependent dehydrogenase